MIEDKNSRQADEAGVVKEAVIPIVEERVRVERQETGGRTVSVTTRPVTEEVAFNEPLIREEVTVERVPVGKVVEEMPKVREEGDLTVVPVVEERITVTKDLVVTEEIHLRRTRSETTEEGVVERTRTEVVVDEDASAS